MPVYNHQCREVPEHEFELKYSMHDDPCTVCVYCGAEAYRTISATAMPVKDSYRLTALVKAPPGTEYYDQTKKQNPLLPEWAKDKW